MNRITLLLFSLLTFCLGLNLPIAATSQKTPERNNSVQGEIDPFAVAIYADPNYKKRIATYRLLPGTRMRKIHAAWPYPAPYWVDYGSDYRRRPKSILVGAKVAVYLFPRRGFSSRTVARGQRYHLLSYLRFLKSTPLITHSLLGNSDHFGGPAGTSKQYSLVIHRKDIPDLLGVYLSSGDLSSKECSGQFYSLPVKGKDTAVNYPKIPHGGPFRLSLMAGGNHQLAWSAKGSAHPNANDIEIIVDFANGFTRKLPGKTIGSPPISWNFNPKNGFISSLRMRYIGPYRTDNYLHTPKVHRAPSAKGKAKEGLAKLRLNTEQLKQNKMVMAETNEDVTLSMFVNLRTHKGLYLAAEMGGGGPVFANRKQAREWETFNLIDLNGGQLLSGDRVRFMTHDRKHYLMAEEGGGGPVNANSPNAGPWETFTIRKVSGAGSINSGDSVSLQASNKQYLVAEKGGGGIVNANRPKAGPWETFVLIKSK
ncbi:MAG: hypothetical protein ABFR75_10310 [Acidobacteriota bacterium]